MTTKTTTNTNGASVKFDIHMRYIADCNREIIAHDLTSEQVKTLISTRYPADQDIHHCLFGRRDDFSDCVWLFGDHLYTAEIA